MRTKNPTQDLRSFASLSKQTTTIPVYSAMNNKQTYSRSRMTQTASIRYKTISAYGQRLWTSLPKIAPTVVDEYEIQRYMRDGSKVKFQTLYVDQSRQLHINQLMFNLFMQGPSFSPALLKQDALRERDLSGKTPLHYAASGNVNLQIPTIKNRLVQQLLGIQDKYGVSALMIAAERGDLVNIQALIQEVGLQDNKGMTAAMHAAVHKKAAAVFVLLQFEENFADLQNQTLIDYLRHYGIQDQVEKMRVQKKVQQKTVVNKNDAFIESGNEQQLKQNDNQLMTLAYSKDL